MVWLTDSCIVKQGYTFFPSSVYSILKAIFENKIVCDYGKKKKLQVDKYLPINLMTSHRTSTQGTYSLKTKSNPGPGAVAYACNPSTLRGRGRQIT